MVRLVLTPNGNTFDEVSFRNYLLDICKQHFNSSRALAFAFIVYDFDDTTVPQIIENEKYWTALDKISGHFLSVFYINTQNDYYKRRQMEIYKEELAQQKRTAKGGYFQMMRQITLKDTPLDKSIDFLKNEFNLEGSIQTPFVLFFQIDGEDILDCFVVMLKQEKLEDAFLELKTQIKNAVDSVSKVTPDNFKNHKEIFDLIETGVKGGNSINFIKTKIISKISIGTIISFIKLVTGH
jgi:hypothetical protein